MRLLIIILSLVTSITFGQKSKPIIQCEKVIDSLTSKEIYHAVDNQANVIGGMQKLYSELGTLKIPKDTEPDQIKIFISFIVEADGKITDLRTIGKMRNTTLDNELFKLFKKYKWEPGMCKNVKVPTRLMLMIVS